VERHIDGEPGAVDTAEGGAAEAPLFEEEFPSLSMGCRVLIIPHGEGCSSGTRRQERAGVIRECVFISSGMFRMAKREEQDWRKKKADEIKAMFVVQVPSTR
jgi:hypothetical protein